MLKAKKCVKGKSCGSTCVQSDRKCRKDLDPQLSPATSKVAELIKGKTGVKEAAAPAGATLKPPKETSSDLNKKYSSLAKQAQEAMNKGDMANGMRLQKEAMSVMAKIRDKEEKQNPKAQEKEQRAQKVLSDLKKVKVSETTKLSSDSKGVYITDKVGNNEVQTLITPKSDGSFEVGYKINGSYAKGNITDNREKVRLALTAKRQFEQALSALKEGTKVRAVAFDDDGGGELRRKAYEKMGFKHQGNNVMTGVISGGKVQGMDFAEKKMDGMSQDEIWRALIFGDEG